MEEPEVVTEAIDTTAWGAFWFEVEEALAYLQNSFLSFLLSPWGQIQIGLVILLFVVALVAGRTIAPSLEARLAARLEAHPWLQAVIVLVRRTRLVVFVLGAWFTVGIMRAATWPSRSYLIGVFASIATVWLVASLITRHVENRFMAKILTAAIWIVAALQLLGLMPITVDVLDAAAVTIGETRLSLLAVVKAFAILALLLWAATLLSRFTEARVQKIEEISPSVRVLTGKLVRIALFTVAIMIGLQTIGFNLTGLTVFSGAVGVGVGFGLQKVVSNLVSGVILLVDKSIKPGDVIEVGNTFGWIAELGGRYVSVLTRDGREYLIPNEDLITNQVINWSHTDPRVRLEVKFGVSYDSDPHLVRKIAVEAAVKPKRVLSRPVPVCHLVDFGDSSIDFVLRFWISDPSVGVVNIKGEVLLALWDALKDNGISIPYPHRDVLIRNPAELRDRDRPAAPPPSD